MMRGGAVKASDIIAAFIAEQHIRHVFAITGGASIHMIHSIAERNDVQYICPHHEQAGAMAADAYARVSGGLGCAIATSGPGATNLLTGIACAWFDSIPTLFLTGQVARFRFKGDTGVRQMGFQETDIVSMARPITKSAVTVLDARDLRYELERAVYIAKSGRPGPVLVDIPDDLQREMVDPSALRAFDPIKDGESMAAPAKGPEPAAIDRCRQLLQAAQRPVLVIGSGVRLSGAQAIIGTLIDRLGMPVCPSWAAADLVPGDHPLLAGTFGTHGTRAGNFTVQNADLVLSIGARLSTRETGSPLSSWAREARTIVVDIDPAELRKFPAFGKPLDLPIEADARIFCEALLATMPETRSTLGAWTERVQAWRRNYPSCMPAYRQERTTNPYVFVEALAEASKPGDVIVMDTGCAVAWMMQGFKPKRGQRLIHDFNNTAMGYGLPAAIGAAFALGGTRPVTCVVGDGSFMMNLQELATVAHHRLPIKIFVINNDGYSMVQQTQEQWLGAKYHATSPEGGLSFPDFAPLARSFGIEAVRIEANAEVAPRVSQVLSASGPMLCDVVIPRQARVVPQSRFGFPIEDSEPLLPRKEFLANMVARPMPVSLSEQAERLIGEPTATPQR